jgi:hypothetical protein
MTIRLGLTLLAPVLPLSSLLAQDELIPSRVTGVGNPYT